MRYQQSKGHRIKSYGYEGIFSLGDYWYVTFNSGIKGILSNDGISKLKGQYEDCSNYIPCRSVRRYRKILKKHPFLKDTVLMSKWHKNDVFQNNKEV